MVSELAGTTKQLDTSVRRIAGQEAALADLQLKLSLAEKEAAGAKAGLDAEKRRGDAAEAERLRQAESVTLARPDHPHEQES